MIRPDWLTAVITQSQAVAGRAQLINPEDIERLVKDFVHALPRPATHLERLVLRAVLLDVAWQCGHAVHTRVHRTDARPCAFVPATVLEYFWKAPASDPCAGFATWVHAFARAFASAHPPTPASRAAKIIRADFDRTWSVAALATLVHATPSQLRRQFALEYGVSIHEYQRALRMMTALAQVPRDKIGAIAMAVGYRNRTNFNAAFHKATGLTPAAFRRLSPERAGQIADSLGRARETRRRGRKNE